MVAGNSITAITTLNGIEHYGKAEIVRLDLKKSFNSKLSTGDVLYEDTHRSGVQGE